MMPYKVVCQPRKAKNRPALVEICLQRVIPAAGMQDDQRHIAEPVKLLDQPAGHAGAIDVSRMELHLGRAQNSIVDPGGRGQ